LLVTIQLQSARVVHLHQAAEQDSKVQVVPTPFLVHTQPQAEAVEVDSKTLHRRTASMVVRAVAQVNLLALEQ
jgi:hypothetical protein